MSSETRGQPRTKWTRSPAWVFVLFVAWGLLSLWLLPAPFLWIFAAAVIALGWMCTLVETPTRAGICVSLATFAAMFGAIEGYARVRTLPIVAERRDPTITASHPWVVADETLGYAPVPSTTVVVQSAFRGQSIYRVTYTIGPDGLRLAPSLPSGSNGCALFFGDSFTFGEGVEDRETTPYLVAERANVRTYNFGFGGYGPHQMLANIQSGRVRKRVSCVPQAIVFQFIQDHSSRAAGLDSWDFHGPRYVRTSEGVQLQGHFDDSVMRRLLNRSFAFARYWHFIELLPAVTARDVALFGGIISEARRELLARYPDATFTAIMWDPPSNRLSRDEGETLRALGVQVVNATEIVPGYQRNSASYQLHPYDSHPTPLSYSFVANYVIEHLLKSDTKASQSRAGQR